MDIVNLYTNTPVKATLQILRENLAENNKLNAQTTDELNGLLEIVLEQNYFTFNNQILNQDDGLASLPLYGLLTDVYLDFYENSFLLSNNI